MVTANMTIDHGPPCPWQNDERSQTNEEAETAKTPPPKATRISPIPRVCLSRSEAARALGIGLSTLKALERNGAAPPYFDLPGNRRRYPVQSLTEWAERRAAGAQKDASNSQKNR